MSRPFRTNLFRLRLNWQNTQTKGRDESNQHEQTYAGRDYIGNFRKTLPTTDGRCDPADYLALRTAVIKGEYYRLDGRARGLVDPAASQYLTVTGVEPSCTMIGKSAPTLDSVEMARDMLQLYAMSLVRDVPFIDYATDPLVSRVAYQLKQHPLTLFGDAPFISQLLLLQPFAVLQVKDYLTTHSEYDIVHSGQVQLPAREQLYQPQKRYISNLRDLASYTYYDYPSQPYHEACLYLLQQHRAALVNPYKGQPYNGFIAFNTPFVLELIGQAAGLALKTVWYHKWLVFRQARPEELGYEVDRLLSGRAEPFDRQFHSELLQAELLQWVKEKQGNWLLTQTFPDGCPAHPAYPAGHSTIAGACATVMKGLFLHDYELSNPKQANGRGELVSWAGGALKLGDEIDKLAHNIGVGRCAAGVHYHADNEAGFLLGEQIGLNLLREAKACLKLSEVVFTVRTFGQKVVRI